MISYSELSHYQFLVWKYIFISHKYDFLIYVESYIIKLLCKRKDAKPTVKLNLQNHIEKYKYKYLIIIILYQGYIFPDLVILLF